jgi:hypothetical protein
MDLNYQITIKGLEEKPATDIGNAVSEVINAIHQVDEILDFRRMHRIILTADFAKELEELSSSTASGNPITHTNEEYAVTVAKVMLLPRGEEFEILPIINANVAAALVRENLADKEKDSFRNVVHLLHHELFHVHDDNKKIDAFPQIMLRHRYTGKDMFIRPLADTCWSEYVANLLSSPTVTEGVVRDLTECFAEAITRTKPAIDRAILSYRFHADLDHLLSVFQRHGEFLIKTAAYTLGYVDGLEKSLSDLNAEAAKVLSGSYFEPTWNAMHAALKEMYTKYPDNWKGLEVYDDLAAVAEDYYASMGLVLSTTEDGRAYVTVPF